METLNQTPSGNAPTDLTVSVVMPCYNAAPYIAQAIDSVLAQSHSHVELIVVDDGSTDSSLNIIEGYGNDLILIRQANSGPSRARNRGILAASGRYLAFLDADDYWHPQFLQRLLGTLRGSDAVLVYCGWQIVDADGTVRAPFIPPDYENADKAIALLRNASLWPIHGMLTYRQAVIDIGMFDERLPACEDYDLWLRLTMERPIIRVPESLAYYRWHKPLHETDKRAVDAEYIRRIKHDYLSSHPEIRRMLSVPVIRDCIEGGFIRRGRQCLMRGEYKSAQRIFRRVWQEKTYGLRDLPYVMTALLPEPLFRQLAPKPRST